MALHSPTEEKRAAGERLWPSASTVVAALAALALLAGPAAGAEFDTLVYQNDYSEVDDGDNPPGWSTFDEGWAVDGPNDQYRWERSDGEPTEAAAYYTGDLDNGGDPSELTDYRVVAPMTFSSSVIGGITARYSDVDNLYSLRRGRDNNLEIIKRDSDGDSFAKLDETASDSIDSSGTLEFIVEGDSLTGNWYDGPTSGTPTATVSASDAARGSGTFGFRAFDQGAALYSDSVSVYVPEPTSLSLLGLGAGLMLMRRRAREM